MRLARLGTVIFIILATAVWAAAQTAATVAVDTTASLTVKNNRATTLELALPQEPPVPLEGLASLKRESYRARPGDSIARLMVRFGLSEAERKLWVRAIEEHYSGKNLAVGTDLHFYFNRPDPLARGEDGRDRLKAFEIEISEDWVLTWEKGNKGIVFTKRERPYDIERKTGAGTVETIPFGDGAQAGLAPGLLSDLVDIFSWDIDFDRNVQRGDTFRIVYEERTRKGSARKPLLQILAAEIISAGQRYFAIYFEKEKGKGGYYDLDGRSLARAFLRFPLEFTSISSYFTHARPHPILKIDRSHHGVDFVAGRGTPVRAIGDGRVAHAGWKKDGYGRRVEIQHDFAYATRYAHLERFTKGIRAGVNVKKGQVIGYVGSSGLATGPHLHFELYKDQQYVDPLNFEFPREDRIEPALRRAFEDLKRHLLAQLAATPHS
jgi:murein DD-endopeptidase MepM/ murein hydrolase activator NlpD